MTTDALLIFLRLFLFLSLFLNPSMSTRKVYRGLGKMLLPPQFWVPHGSPAWRGGVERAFMSTTADKGVALFYANGRGTVVEISVGRIQIGGDVTFLSMVTPPPPSFPAPSLPLLTPRCRPSRAAAERISMEVARLSAVSPIPSLLTADRGAAVAGWGLLG